MGPFDWRAVKILTVCKHGLVRSVALADVLKLHFEPVDVVPVGVVSNSQETLQKLADWADFIVFMEAQYVSRFPYSLANQNKIRVCDVGADSYGNSHSPELIDKCWNWCRVHIKDLGIQEHDRSL
jgi:predicted protein tyrosine phosphatase